MFTLQRPASDFWARSGLQRQALKAKRRFRRSTTAGETIRYDWSQIIDKTEDEDVVCVIETGKIKTGIRDLRSKLLKYRKIAYDRNCRKEAQCLVMLVAKVSQMESILGMHRGSQTIDDVFKEKEQNDRDLYETLAELEEERRLCQKTHFSKYVNSVNIINEMFSNLEYIARLVKPSKQLMILRERAQILIKQRRYDEAKATSKELRELEMEETRRANDLIQSKYDTDCANVKKKYLAKRDKINEVFKAKKSAAKAQKAMKDERLKRKFARIEKEMSSESEKSSLKSRRSSMGSSSQHSETDGSASELEAGVANKVKAVHDRVWTKSTL